MRWVTPDKRLRTAGDRPAGMCGFRSFVLADHRHVSPGYRTDPANTTLVDVLGPRSRGPGLLSLWSAPRTQKSPRGLGLQPRPESWFGERPGSLQMESRCAGVTSQCVPSSAGRAWRGVSWAFLSPTSEPPQVMLIKHPSKTTVKKRTPTFRGPPGRPLPDLAPYMGTVGGGGHWLWHKPALHSPPRRPKFGRH